MTKFNGNRDDRNDKNPQKNKHDKAQESAENLGNIESLDDSIQKEIPQLRRKSIVPLQQVSHLHDWLEGKRKSRQSCRIVGETRTGMTITCEAYKSKHKPKQKISKPPRIETK